MAATSMLTVKQAAEELAVSIGTIYGLCRRRELAHERPGSGRGAVRIPRHALAAYRAARAFTVVAPAEPPASRRVGAKGETLDGPRRLSPPERWGYGAR